MAAASANRYTLKLLTGVYGGALSLSRKLDIHGDAVTLVTDGEDNLHVVDTAKVRIYGLAIVNNSIGIAARYGFLCESLDGINTPELSLERVVVETKLAPGFINLCRLKVSRSTLKSPRNETEHYTFVAGPNGVASFDRTSFIGGGSIVAYAGRATITNSVLDGVLGRASEGALLVSANASISISFSTIVDSPILCNRTESAACASAARDGLCIDNSIVNKPSSPTDAVSGTSGCQFDYSIISPQQAAVPGSNNMVGAAPNLRDVANRDFHLNADSPAVNAANPTAIVTPDYDGVTRPQGGRSDIGAFELKP